MSSDDINHIINFLFPAQTTEPESIIHTERSSAPLSAVVAESTEIFENLSVTESNTGDADVIGESTPALPHSEEATAAHPFLPDSLKLSPSREMAVNTLKELAGKDYNNGSVYIYTTNPEIITPVLNGNAVNDARYYRTKLVEDKYNINVHSLMAEDDIYGKISAAINAGDYLCDVLILPIEVNSLLIRHGLLSNIRKIPFINLTAPYYKRELSELSSTGDYIYQMDSDLTFMPDNINVIYYNKDLTKQFDLPDPANYFADGSWTYDKFTQYIKYGLAMDINDDTAFDLFVSSSGLKYSDYKNYAVPQISYNTSFTHELLDKLRNLFSADNIENYIYSSSDSDELKNSFTNGNVLLYPSDLSHVNEFSVLPFSWGILPYPTLYENAGVRYKNTVPASSLSISFIKGAGNTELCGLITEALSAASYKHIEEEYVTEKMLYYLRDVSSVKVLNNLLYNETYSFPAIYKNSHEVQSSTLNVLRESTFANKDFTRLYDGNIQPGNQFLNSIKKR